MIIKCQYGWSMNDCAVVHKTMEQMLPAKFLALFLLSVCYALHNAITNKNIMYRTVM